MKEEWILFFCLMVYRSHNISRVVAVYARYDTWSLLSK